MSEVVEGGTVSVPEVPTKSFTPPEKPSVQQAALWERLSAPTPPEEAVTQEVVAGEPEPAPETKSDRELVAPRLRQFFKQPEAEAPAEEPAQEGELTPDQLILQKLEALEAEREAIKQQKVVEAQEAEFRAIRDALLANVEEHKESLPGFFALEQQDTLVQLAVQAAEAGEEASEIDIAREIESKARETWEKLNAIYGETPSKEPAPAQPAEPSPTLSQTIVSATEPLDLSEMSPADAKAALWERLKNARG